MRHSKDFIRSYFKRFIEFIGGRVATSYDDVGAFVLDEYNGYQIGLITSKTGGINTPFGSGRLTTNEFFEAIDFAKNTLRFLEKA